MSEKTVDFCDGTWKIGDSVFHSEYGWTEIQNIELIPNRICVKSQWFRADGRSGRMSALPTIFPNKFTVPDEAYERPVERPDLAMDTPIWVKKGHYWIPKHFAGWAEDGWVKYWLDGCSSHTGSVAVTTDEWRLDDPEKEQNDEQN